MILNTMELERKYGHLPVKEYAQKVAEEYEKVWATQIFEQLMDLYEFRFYKAKNEDGETILKLEDLQGANLGDIESEEFRDFGEIIDRMDAYHNDYIVECLESVVDEELTDIECEWANWEELYDICMQNIERLQDYKFDISALYIITHSNILKGVCDRL